MKRVIISKYVKHIGRKVSSDYKIFFDIYRIVYLNTQSKISNPTTKALLLPINESDKSDLHLKNLFTEV